MSYGPQLPAWLTNNQNPEEESEDKEKEEEDEGPISYGPIIPTQKTTERNEEEDEDDDVETGAYGPTIPKISSIPSSKQEENDGEEEDDDDDYAEHSYGPSIPTNFRRNFGPSLPGINNDDSDDEIGPMPVAQGNEEKEALERAYRMVMQKEAEDEEKNSQPKREEWMTSVPKKLGNFGLGPRTFKKGTVSERDSSWEDAPGAKKKRKDDGKTLKSVGAAAADARQAAIVAEKASGPSLLELHQKQREEKVKDAGYAPGERRPFDRDKDMEVRGLKPGGSKEAVDKMKELQGRFANSKEKKFL